MARITSKHSGLLGLPMGGIILRPGVATEVPNWEVMKNHNVVKQWIAADLFDVDDSAQGSRKSTAAKSSSTDGGGAPGTGASVPGATPTADELAALAGNGGGSGGANDEGEANDAELTDDEKARAKELGIKYTWNTKPATVRARIAEESAK